MPIDNPNAGSPDGGQPDPEGLGGTQPEGTPSGSPDGGQPQPAPVDAFMEKKGFKSQADVIQAYESLEAFSRRETASKEGLAQQIRETNERIDELGPQGEPATFDQKWEEDPEAALTEVLTKVVAPLRSEIKPLQEEADRTQGYQYG